MAVDMPDDEVWEGFGMAVMCLEETGDSLANRTRLVRQLLDQGMPADYSDDGKTLLHTCARKGLTSFAKELIDRGANVNARFDDLKEFARGNPMLAKQSAEWRRRSCLPHSRVTRAVSGCCSSTERASTFGFRTKPDFRSDLAPMPR